VASNQSDEQLFLLIREGNQSAFEELFNRYWEIMLRSAQKVLNNSSAGEDLVQEIFVKDYNLDPVI
jgi:RNA polymerase sigma-70 factor (ECF subfamily)